MAARKWQNVERERERERERISLVHSASLDYEDGHAFMCGPFQNSCEAMDDRLLVFVANDDEHTLFHRFSLVGCQPR